MKMYNKSGNILRIETMTNSTRGFQVYRHTDDNLNRPGFWQKMCEGVGDVHCRCEMSDRCNNRYEDAPASAHAAERLKEMVAPTFNKIRKNGKSCWGSSRGKPGTINCLAS